MDLILGVSTVGVLVRMSCVAGVIVSWLVAAHILAGSRPAQIEQRKVKKVNWKNHGNNSQMQLWVEYTPTQGGANQYRFVVRNVDYASGGRRCELDSGSRDTEAAATAAGQISFHTLTGTV